MHALNASDRVCVWCLQLLGITAGFGLVGYVGTLFSGISVLIPFIIMGISIDDMIVMHGTVALHPS